MKPIPTLIAVLIFVLVGSVMITQRLELTSIGYEVGRIQRDKRKVEEQNRWFDSELSRQMSYQTISRLVEEHRLPLVPPTDGDGVAAAKPDKTPKRKA